MVHGLRRLAVLGVSTLVMVLGLAVPAAADDVGGPSDKREPSTGGLAAGAHRKATPLPDGDPFHALVPARIVDTRTAGGSRLAAGATRDVQVTGLGGVPTSGVSAVVMNVTGVSASAATYLAVWPAASPRPNASTLNLSPGQTRANLTEVKLSASGRVSVFNSAGSVDLLLDVAGWVGPATSADPGGELRAGQPARLLDTRSGVGAPKGAVAAGRSVDLRVTGRDGVPASGVAAVVLNVTSTQPSASAFVTVWPKGETRPNASNLNVPAGSTTPNRVIVKVGTDGTVGLFHNAGSMHLVADVTGYFTATSGTDVVGSAFTGVDPFRAVDTRDGTGVARARLGPGKTLTVPVSGAHGIPGVRSERPPTAVVANVTGVGSTASTYLTAWPTGLPRPGTSDVNLAARQVVPALVIAKLGPDGSITVYNDSGQVDVLVDVLGYYSGDVALDPQAVILTAAETAAVNDVTSRSVTFDAAAVADAGIVVGSVISAGVGPHTPYGLLRRVTAVSRSGQALVAQTEPAAITDIIRFGSLHASGQAQNPVVVKGTGKVARRTAARAGVSNGVSVSLDHTYVDQGGASVTTTGSFEVEAGLDVDIDVGWDGLHSASIIGHASEALNARLDVDYEGSWSEQVHLADVSFSPIEFTIGPLFIEVQPQLSLDSRVGGSAKGHADVSFTQSEYVTSGVAYDGGDLHSVQDRVSQPPTVDGPHATAQIEGKVAVDATLNAAFYGGVANLGVGLSPYERVKGTQCHISAYNGIDGSVHADFSILGLEKQHDDYLNLVENTLVSKDLPGECWRGSLTFDGKLHYDFGEAQHYADQVWKMTLTDVRPTDTADEYTAVLTSTRHSLQVQPYYGSYCSQTIDLAIKPRRVPITISTELVDGKLQGVIQVDPGRTVILDYTGKAVQFGPEPPCQQVTEDYFSHDPVVGMCDQSLDVRDETVSTTKIEGEHRIDQASGKDTCSSTEKWDFDLRAGP